MSIVEYKRGYCVGQVTDCADTDSISPTYPTSPNIASSRAIHVARLQLKFILYSLFFIALICFPIMPRRRKHRTHKKAAPTEEVNDGNPKSFILKHGQVGSSLAQLVRDLRKVMEPNTASRLKVGGSMLVLDNQILIWSAGADKKQTKRLPNHRTCAARYAFTCVHTSTCCSFLTARPTVFWTDTHIPRRALLSL